MKKSKVMDHVSSQGCQDLEDDDDRDENENSMRAGTPPHITKKNSFSRDLSKTSIEMRNSRNMAKAST